MKKKKQIIINLIICVIIIIAILLVLLVKIAKKSKIKDEEILERKDQIVSDNVEDKALIRTNNAKLYYTVDECLKSYISMMKIKDVSVIMSYLNEYYIKNKNINDKNIFDIVQRYDDDSTYRTVEMYEISKSEVMVYYVMSRINSNNIYFIVRLDVNNKTFDIEPITKEVYEQCISDKDNIGDKEANLIAKKEYNHFVYKELNDELIAKLYFADYIKVMLTDTEEAYNLLETEYKNKRFANIDNFKLFIKNNNNRFNYAYKIETSDSSNYKNYYDYYKFLQNYGDFGLKEYLVTKYSDYTRYICVDGFNNYFTFYVTNPGIYTVRVDSHTIDTDEFIEKYNSASEKVKVGMNIEKILESINSKDYKYVYDKLDKTFKKNNYSTLNIFENKMKQEFYDTNKVEYMKFTKEGNIYIYNLGVKNGENENAKEKKLTIIMKLKENTDFEMSFNIE